MVRAMLSVSLEAVITQALLKRKTGGRVAAHEILLGTGAVRNLIREGKIPQMYSLMQMSRKLGMTTMKDSVNALVEDGTIAEHTAKEFLQTSTTPDDDDKPETGARPASNSSASANSGGAKPRNLNEF
jgi:twitching motility protein PilT